MTDPEKQSPVRRAARRVLLAAEKHGALLDSDEVGPAWVRREAKVTHELITAAYHYHLAVEAARTRKGKR